MTSWLAPGSLDEVARFTRTGGDQTFVRRPGTRVRPETGSRFSLDALYILARAPHRARHET